MLESLEGVKLGPFPARFRPMIPREESKPFDREGWFFELKYDGFRTLAEINKGRARLYSREGKSMSLTFPSLRDCLQTIPHQLVLDGEVAVIDEEGQSHFDWIRNYNPKAVNLGRVAYFVFDIVYQDGYNLLEVCLRERKTVLEVLKPSLPDNVVVVLPVITEGKELFKRVRQLGLEGMVAKNPESIYRPGVRTRQWVKVKNYIRRGWNKVIYRQFSEEE